MVGNKIAQGVELAKELLSDKSETLCRNLNDVTLCLPIVDNSSFALQIYYYFFSEYSYLVDLFCVLSLWIGVYVGVSRIFLLDSSRLLQMAA